jgi:hypothetical protein
MNESQWDEKLRAFLKKTGDDLKRAGGDIRLEAERLMKEVQDPDRQDKVKKGLDSFRLWARKTAEEVATVVETGMKKAEGAVRQAVDVKPGAGTSPSDDASSTPNTNDGTGAEPMRHDTPVDTPAAQAPKDEAPSKKTIGGAKKKVAAKTRGGGSKKPLGKKRTP